MFVTFFPQLIAGPIVRHNEIIAQFNLSPRRPDMWENLSRGLLLFLIGAVKKAVDRRYGGDDLQSALPRRRRRAASSAAEAWLAAGSFTLQIYFDFSGYSDMAIGLALMFGLQPALQLQRALSRRFDPRVLAALAHDACRACCATISTFRWAAIAMVRARQAVNVVITMLLGGFWHGANWTFVAWGGLHGMALAINGAWERAGLKLPRGVGWAITLLFVILGLGSIPLA